MSAPTRVAFLEGLRVMARYNRWMNERLYDCCEKLPEARAQARPQRLFPLDPRHPQSPPARRPPVVVAVPRAANSASDRWPKSSIRTSPSCGASARRPTRKSSNGSRPWTKIVSRPLRFRQRRGQQGPQLSPVVRGAAVLQSPDPPPGAADAPCSRRRESTRGVTDLLWLPGDGAERLELYL